MSLLCPVSIAAERFPTRPAVITPHETISYREFHERINAAQELLSKLKAPKMMAVCAPSSLEYLITIMAAWRLGIVTVLLSTRQPPEIIKKQLEHLDCRSVLTDLQSISDVRATSDYPSRIWFNQPATILFTSATTAEPKAVVHTYANHYWSAVGANENMPLKNDDRWLLSLPLYHVGGLAILFRTILAGAAIIVPQAKEDLAVSIAKYAPTHVSLVPAQFLKLTDLKPLKKLKGILMGGSAIPDSIFAAAKKHNLPLFVTYGLTEMSSQVATGKAGGKIEVLKYRQMKVAKDGEVLVKGQTLFKGYWKKGKTILPLIDSGWFKTGDLGRIDRTKGLQVIGRRDNMFISGGENVHPEEIERAINAFDDVELATVVPVKDKQFGLRPVAFVKTRSNHALKTAALTKSLEKTLPGFKIPKIFFPWPVSDNSLKPSRQELQQIAKTQ